MSRGYDIFGRKKSKKQRKREQLEENRDKGKAAEDLSMLDYALRGYDVERSGKGHDFRATRTNWLTGRKETKYVEVKSSKSAELSKLQKKTKKKKNNYKVERVEPLFY